MSRSTRITVGVCASLAVIAAPTGVGIAAHRRDRTDPRLLPAGSMVGTVDVSGLDHDAAVELVREAIEEDLDKPVTVRAGGKSFRTSMRELGVAENAEAAVADAIALARNGSWFGRAWQGMFGAVAGPQTTVHVGEPDPRAVDRFLARVAAAVEVPPQNPGVQVVDGFLRFVPGANGYQLNRSDARAKLRDSLFLGDIPDLTLTPVAPPLPQQAYQTAILVRTGENKLYVYQNGVITRTYGVATGSRRYPTPTGTYEVTLKRYRPTWYNPHTAWSRGMPERIGPGPGNPLGTRALNISADGIRIHGTPASRSIGYSVSHGCIRMHMRDVEALYEIIPVGTPVVIVRAAPARTTTADVDSGTAAAADGG